MVTRMQVRLAEQEDIDRITEMHQSYIQSWHPRDYFERLIDIENPLVVVAVKDNQVIGYTACRVEEQNAHLVSMGVCPLERTKGIGSGMTLAIVEMALKRGLNCIYGHVRGSNTVAIAVYKKCGFSLTWVDEYEDGDEKLEFFMLDSNMESKHRHHQSV
jgi:ribosomal protein S18 acetylase RimI-like enzyme